MSSVPMPLCLRVYDECGGDAEAAFERLLLNPPQQQPQPNGRGGASSTATATAGNSFGVLGDGGAEDSEEAALERALALSQVEAAEREAEDDAREAEEFLNAIQASAEEFQRDFERTLSLLGEDPALHEAYVEAYGIDGAVAVLGSGDGTVGSGGASGTEEAQLAAAIAASMADELAPSEARCFRARCSSRSDPSGGATSTVRGVLTSNNGGIIIDERGRQWWW